MLDDRSLGAAFAAATRNYETEWRVLDEILRTTCRSHPTHTDRAHVNAKLYLVGRSFASGIERQIEKDGTQGGAMKKLTAHLLVNATHLDAQIERLPQDENDADFSNIVEVHGAVVELIRPVLRKRTSPRSFVSKYLHFHCSSVPIYDSVVIKHLPLYVRKSDVIPVVSKPAGADHAYYAYVLAVRALMRRLEDLGVQPTARLTEFLLTMRPDQWKEWAHPRART